MFVVSDKKLIIILIYSVNYLYFRYTDYKVKETKKQNTDKDNQINKLLVVTDRIKHMIEQVEAIVN